MRVLYKIEIGRVKKFKIEDSYLIKCKLQGEGESIDIVNYVKSSEKIAILLNLTKCIFCDDLIDHWETYISDGKWMWSADLVHYTELHKFMWPEDFRLNVRANNFRPLTLSETTFKNTAYFESVVMGRVKIDDEIILK